MNLKVLELEINTAKDLNELFDKHGNLKIDKTIVVDTIKEKQKKTKKEKTPYRSEAIRETIRHFKKKGNCEKITKHYQSRYVYNFEDLCIIIDEIDNLKLQHPVWFKPIPEFDEGFEINFEVNL